jgi:hypothetical protein
VSRACFAALIAETLWIPQIPAAESCPWLNSATAAGFLGGEVTARVVHSSQNKEDANCEFIRSAGGISEARSLSIQVVTMSNARNEFPSFLAKCGGVSAPVRGIGNEAVVCTLHDKKDKTADQVVSRVRNRAFLVRIDTSDKSTVSFREATERTAEQVAGILF